MMNFLRTFCFLLLTVAFANVQAQPGLHPDKGVAMIWYGDQDNINDRDGIVTVGQIFYMWRSFEPAEGDYQFEDLEKQLQEMSRKGMKATIQINGNVHPDYIYKSVPCLKGVQILGTSDHTTGWGAPMYWNKIYKEKYSAMIHALADYLRKSEYKDVVLAIRQSYNAVGTEHHNIPEEYRTKGNAWHREEGVEWGGPWPWTNEIAEDYKRWAIDMYIEAFNAPKDFNIFIRASAIADGLLDMRQLKLVENGDLWLFHTSTEPQPRGVGKDDQYKVFVAYCKTGKTYGFMESWSKAQTYAEKWDWDKTAMPITKEQWNYWTLLCDLHCGATFPAMRPEDIDMANFREDYELTAKYAGYTMKPAKSPGAWIAFREGDWLVGDYSFLMERTENDNCEPLYNVDDSKYGLWARKIKGGNPMELSIQDDFLYSLSESVTVKVWYKDEAENKITFEGLGEQATVNLKGTGGWKIAVMNISVSNKKQLFRLSTEKDMIIHKIQMEK
jgi:hypothetical protein